MSKQANPKVIGVFVVGAVFLVAAALLVFGGGRFFKERKQFVMFFQGSVQGLSKGAPVAFRGVKVGSVTDIKILFDSRDNELRIPVYIEIEPDRLTEPKDVPLEKLMVEAKDGNILGYLVQKGLRAQLDLQSLVTGQLFVNLDFFPGKPARYVSNQTDLVEIPTIPSSLEVLSKTVEQLPISDLASKANKALRGIERWVNSQEFKEIVNSTNQTMKNLAATTQTINEEIKPLLAGIDKIMNETQGLVQDVRAQVNPVVADVKEIAGGAKKLVGTLNNRLDGLASNMEKALSAAEVTLKKAETALSSIDGAVGEDSRIRFEFSNALKELSAAARSLRTLADYLERHPEALLRGKAERGGN
jgi:paraquat-inducible protein B